MLRYLLDGEVSMFFSRKKQRRSNIETLEYIARIGLEEHDKRQRYTMIRRHILKTLVCPMTRSQLFIHLDIVPMYQDFNVALEQLESWELIIVSPSTDEVFGRHGEYGDSFDIIRKSDEIRWLLAAV